MSRNTKKFLTVNILLVASASFVSTVSAFGGKLQYNVNTYNYPLQSSLSASTITWAFGGPVSLSNLNPGDGDQRWHKLRSSPNQMAFISGWLTGATLNVATCKASGTNHCATSAEWTGLGISTSTDTGTDDIFDIAFEQNSGKGLVVSRKNTDILYYNVWNSATNSWGPGYTLNQSLGGNIKWVRLIPRPNSNDIALLYSTTQNKVGFYLWNGSAFSLIDSGNPRCNSLPTVEYSLPFDGAWLNDGLRLLVVCGVGGGNAVSFTYTSSTTSNATSSLGAGNNISHVKLFPNPFDPNRIGFVGMPLSGTSDVSVTGGIWRWNRTNNTGTWIGLSEISATGRSYGGAYYPASGAWFDASTTIVAYAYADGATDSLHAKKLVEGGSWSAADDSLLVTTQAWNNVKLYNNVGNGEMLLFVEDNATAPDFWGFAYNGSTWRNIYGSGTPISDNLDTENAPFDFDFTPPLVTSISGATSQSTLGGYAVTVAGNFFASSTVYVGNATATVTSRSSSSISFNPPAQGVGTYFVQVLNPYMAKRSATSSDYTVTYIASPPGLTLSQSYNPANITSQRTVSGTGIGVTLTCPVKVNGTCITGFATTTTSVTYTTPSLTAGPYTVRVFGVSGSDSPDNGIYANLTTTYENKPSVTGINNSRLAAASSSASAIQRIISGSYISTSTYPVRVISHASGTYVSGASSSITVNMPATSTVGTYDVRVYGRNGTDANGIYTDSTGLVKYVPTIYSINPQAVSTAGGVTVTVTGLAMATGTSMVKVSSTLVNSSGSSSSLTFTAPAIASGTRELRVYGLGGTDGNTLYASTTILYTGPPSVSLNDSYALAGITSQRTVSGTGISVALACPVKVNGSCATVNSTTTTSVTFTTPALSASTYTVRVFGVLGSDSPDNGIYTDLNLTYSSAPSNITISDNHISAYITGLQRTIYGTGLSTSTYPILVAGTLPGVYFSGNSSSIVVTFPSSTPGFKDLRVYGAGGNASNSIYTDLSNYLIYSPTITSFSTTSLSTIGGETLTVYGKGLKVGSQGVKVDPSGTANYATTTGNNDVSVDFTTPAHVAGYITLRVYAPDGTDANGIYAETSSLTYVAPIYTQSGYRWFQNQDGSVPDSPLASANASATFTTAGQTVRLRLLTHLDIAPSVAGDSFKIQVATTTSACSAGATNFADVSSGSGDIRFNDNGSVANGSLLVSTSSDPTHSGHTIVNQTYNESNPIYTTSTIINSKDGLWDFSLKNYSGRRGVTYCFRLVKSDGAVLDSYSAIPTINVFNIAPEVQNVIASQTASGTVAVSYDSRDPDTDAEAATPNLLTPSFEYWNGSSWIAVTTSTLVAGDTNSQSVVSSSFTTHTATWTPKSQVPGVYNTGAKIRVTVNDSEASNSTANAQSGSFALDTANPTITTLTFDSRNDLISLRGNDNSALSYTLSNNNDLSGDGLNASSGLTISVGGVSVSSSLSWNATGTPSYERIYLRLLDALNNSSTLTVVAPETSQNVVMTDTSNPSAAFYSSLISWSSHHDITSSTAQYYEIWRSSNNTSTYSRVATTTNAYYHDLGLDSAITYFYKVAVKTTEGNFSNYSSEVNNRPGSGSVGSIAPEFDPTLFGGLQTGASAAQVSSTSNDNWGKVIITFGIRDRGSASGTINPTYWYNLDGVGWVSIDTLTLNSTSTDPKAVSSSSYSTYSVVWDAARQLPSIYSTNVQTRVTANNGLSSSNADSAAFALDTTAPTLSSSLLVNGASANAEATSTVVNLQVQSITGTPSGENVYLQFSNDDSAWYGAGNSTTTLGSYGTAVSSTAAILSARSWLWTLSGSNTVYLKVIDIYGNTAATTSVEVQGINQSPEIQGLSASQATSSDPRSGGEVVIAYSVSDSDGNSVTPSFAYNTGTGWFTIPSSTLNATSTDAKAVTSSSTTYATIWAATSTVTSTYTTSLQIRLTISDGSTVNSSTVATTTLTFDSKSPTAGSDSLLINGSSTSVGSVSSTITLSLQNITGNPSGETIFAQFSDDNSTWYGADANGTLASSSSWGSGFSSDSSTWNILTWPFAVGGRSRTIYFRATDAFGNGLISDTNSVGYNTPPEFNPSYETNGLSVAQASSSLDSDWGKVKIQYNIRDTDTLVNSSTPGYISPSFEYNIGLGWFDISSSTLANGDVSNKAVSDTSYTTYSATWNASSQVPSVYTTALQIRATLNDNEPVSNTTQATSSQIVLDTKSPTVTAQADSRVSRISVIASDDSLIEYNLSNSASLVTDGVNASSGLWITTNATSTNTSSSWTLVVNSSSLNTVYYSIRDALGNIVSGSASAPAAPASTTIADVSDTTASVYKELVSWTVYTSTSSAPFSKYEIYRATSSEASAFSLLDSVTNVSQNYYSDTNLNASTTYYYKVSIVTTNGDYSDYGSTVSDQPDGLSGAAAEGPTISNVQAAEVQASWARMTWDTDRVSDSKVEYSTATSSPLYSLSTSTVTLVVSHDVYVGGLEPNTTYSFRVVSKDVNNKESTAVGTNFTTLGGPIISGVTTESVTDHTAAITWNTNKDSNSTVIYSTILQNLRDGTSTLQAGNSGMVGSPFQHRVTLSGLNTQTTYYYYVQSTDASSNISKDKNGGDYYTFTTARDTKAPTISNITVAAVTKNAAVVTWQTDELANSQMTYDTRSASSSGLPHSNTTVLDDTLTANHAVTISGLTASTVYYFKVLSTDAASNSTTSDENNLETSDSETVIINVTGGGAPAPPANTIIKDTQAPTISKVTVSDILPFSAKITFDTDEKSLGFVSFGEGTSYGRTLGEPEYRINHVINLVNLKLGTTYHFQVKASDQSGNFTTAPDENFTTKFAVESAHDIAKLESIEQYQSQIDALIESITPSLITPFIGKIEISELTEDSAVIKWTTNTKTYGAVLYVADKDYDAKKENPYLAEVGDTQTKTVAHQVKLSNLSPGQLYRFKIKAYTLPNVVSGSQEKTFITKSSKIHPDVVRLLNTSFVVTWQTSKKTTSFVEYLNTRTKQIKQSGNDTSVIGHVVNVENLDPNTTYRVRAFGYDENNNLVESETINVITKKDITPPVISNLKIDNAFVPGRNDRIQTVISWKTNEPASSLVLFGEGSATAKKELPNAASSTDASLSLNHNVIITNFKPGTIYQMQVVSIDSAGNRAASPIRVIITPKVTQSVYDVIVKNFEGTFKFMNTR
jgi:hypothetical protein